MCIRYTGVDKRILVASNFIMLSSPEVKYLNGAQTLRVFINNTLKGKGDEVLIVDSIVCGIIIR